MTRGNRCSTTPRGAAVLPLTGPEGFVMKHLALIGLLALGPILAGCKTFSPPPLTQSGIDQCENVKSRGKSDCGL